MPFWWFPHQRRAVPVVGIIFLAMALGFGVGTVVRAVKYEVLTPEQQAVIDPLRKISKEWGAACPTFSYSYGEPVVGYEYYLMNGEALPPISEALCSCPAAYKDTSDPSGYSYFAPDSTGGEPIDYRDVRGNCCAKGIKEVYDKAKKEAEDLAKKGDEIAGTVHSILLAKAAEMTSAVGEVVAPGLDAYPEALQPALKDLYDEPATGLKNYFKVLVYTARKGNTSASGLSDEEKQWVTANFCYCSPGDDSCIYRTTCAECVYDGEDFVQPGVYPDEEGYCCDKSGSASTDDIVCAKDGVSYESRRVKKSECSGTFFPVYTDPKAFENCKKCMQSTSSSSTSSVSSTSKSSSASEDSYVSKLDEAWKLDEAYGVYRKQFRIKVRVPEDAEYVTVKDVLQPDGPFALVDLQGATCVKNGLGFTCEGIKDGGATVSYALTIPEAKMEECLNYQPYTNTVTVSAYADGGTQEVAKQSIKFYCPGYDPASGSSRSKNAYSTSSASKSSGNDISVNKQGAGWKLEGEKYVQNFTITANLPAGGDTSYWYVKDSWTGANGLALADAPPTLVQQGCAKDGNGFQCQLGGKNEPTNITYTFTYPAEDVRYCVVGKPLTVNTVEVRDDNGVRGTYKLDVPCPGASSSSSYSSSSISSKSASSAKSKGPLSITKKLVSTAVDPDIRKLVSTFEIQVTRNTSETEAILLGFRDLFKEAEFALVNPADVTASLVAVGENARPACTRGSEGLSCQSTLPTAVKTYTFRLRLLNKCRTFKGDDPADTVTYGKTVTGGTNLVRLHKLESGADAMTDANYQDQASAFASCQDSWDAFGAVFSGEPRGYCCTKYTCGSKYMQTKETCSGGWNSDRTVCKSSCDEEACCAVGSSVTDASLVQSCVPRVDTTSQFACLEAAQTKPISSCSGEGSSACCDSSKGEELALYEEHPYGESSPYIGCCLPQYQAKDSEGKMHCCNDSGDPASRTFANGQCGGAKLKITEYAIYEVPAGAGQDRSKWKNVTGKTVSKNADLRAVAKVERPLPDSASSDTGLTARAEFQANQHLEVLPSYPNFIFDVPTYLDPGVIVQKPKPLFMQRALAAASDGYVYAGSVQFAPGKKDAELVFGVRFKDGTQERAVGWTQLAVKSSRTQGVSQAPLARPSFAAQLLPKALADGSSGTPDDEKSAPVKAGGEGDFVIKMHKVDPTIGKNAKRLVELPNGGNATPGATYELEVLMEGPEFTGKQLSVAFPVKWDGIPDGFFEALSDDKKHPGCFFDQENKDTNTTTCSSLEQLPVVNGKKSFIDHWNIPLCSSDTHTVTATYGGKIKTFTYTVKCAGDFTVDIQKNDKVVEDGEMVRPFEDKTKVRLEVRNSTNAKLTGAKVELKYDTNVVSLVGKNITIPGSWNPLVWTSERTAFFAAAEVFDENSNGETPVASPQMCEWDDTAKTLTCSLPDISAGRKVIVLLPINKIKKCNQQVQFDGTLVRSAGGNLKDGAMLNSNCRPGFSFTADKPSVKPGDELTLTYTVDKLPSGRKVVMLTQFHFENKSIFTITSIESADFGPSSLVCIPNNGDGDKETINATPAEGDYSRFGKMQCTFGTSSTVTVKGKITEDKKHLCAIKNKTIPFPSKFTYQVEPPYVEEPKAEVKIDVNCDGPLKAEIVPPVKIEPENKHDYMLKLTHGGDTTVYDVQATFRLPANETLTITAADIVTEPATTEPCTVQEAKKPDGTVLGRDVLCKFGELKKGQNATITVPLYVAKQDCAKVDGKNLTSALFVSYHEEDASGSVGAKRTVSDTKDTPIICKKDECEVGLLMTDDEEFIFGKDYTYGVTFKNTGGKNIEGAKLVPSDANAGKWVGMAVDGTKQDDASLGSVAPGQEKQAVFTFNLSATDAQCPSDGSNAGKQVEVPVKIVARDVTCNPSTAESTLVFTCPDVSKGKGVCEAYDTSTDEPLKKIEFNMKKLQLQIVGLRVKPEGAATVKNVKVARSLAPGEFAKYMASGLLVNEEKGGVHDIPDLNEEKTLVYQFEARKAYCDEVAEADRKPITLAFDVQTSGVKTGTCTVEAELDCGAPSTTCDEGVCVTKELADKFTKKGGTILKPNYDVGYKIVLENENDKEVEVKLSDPAWDTKSIKNCTVTGKDCEVTLPKATIEGGEVKKKGTVEVTFTANMEKCTEVTNTATVTVDGKTRDVSVDLEKDDWTNAKPSISCEDEQYICCNNPENAGRCEDAEEKGGKLVCEKGKVRKVKAGEDFDDACDDACKTVPVPKEEFGACCDANKPPCVVANKDIASGKLTCPSGGQPVKGNTQDKANQACNAACGAGQPGGGQPGGGEPGGGQPGGGEPGGGQPGGGQPGGGSPGGGSPGGGSPGGGSPGGGSPGGGSPGGGSDDGGVDGGRDGGVGGGASSRTSSSSSRSIPAGCGNGLPDPGEQCDPGPKVPVGPLPGLLLPRFLSAQVTTPVQRLVCSVSPGGSTLFCATAAQQNACLSAGGVCSLNRSLFNFRCQGGSANGIDCDIGAGSQEKSQVACVQGGGVCACSDRSGGQACNISPTTGQISTVSSPLPSFPLVPNPPSGGVAPQKPSQGCREDCTLIRCGDGIPDPGEECDDGNTFDFDGCSRSCKKEIRSSSSSSAKSQVASSKSQVASSKSQVSSAKSQVSSSQQAVSSRQSSSLTSKQSSSSSSFSSRPSSSSSSSHSSIPSFSSVSSSKSQHSSIRSSSSSFSHSSIPSFSSSSSRSSLSSSSLSSSRTPDSFCCTIDQGCVPGLGCAHPTLPLCQAFCGGGSSTSSQPSVGSSQSSVVSSSQSSSLSAHSSSSSQPVTCGTRLFLFCGGTCPIDQSCQDIGWSCGCVPTGGSSSSAMSSSSTQSSSFSTQSSSRSSFSAQSSSLPSSSASSRTPDSFCCTIDRGCVPGLGCAHPTLPLCQAFCGGGSSTSSQQSVDSSQSSVVSSSQSSSLSAHSSSFSSLSAQSSSLSSFSTSSERSAVSSSSSVQSSSISVHSSSFSSLSAQSSSSSSSSAQTSSRIITDVRCTNHSDCSDRNACTYDTCLQGFCVYDQVFCPASLVCERTSGLCTCPPDRPLFCPGQNRCIDPLYESCNPIQPGYCGNYLIEPNEECDPPAPPGFVGSADQNLFCNAFCTLEYSYPYPQSSSTAQSSRPLVPGPNPNPNPYPICGNGVPEGFEQCDDGNTLSGDGCSVSCRYETPLITPIASCGNGTVENGEECDDGNTLDGDGCATTCYLERGYCGDGVIQQALNEQCEPSFVLQNGLTCSPNCRYILSRCGDGLKNVGEACDDGTQNSNVPNTRCRPDCSYARCGDGIADANEQCDDRNNVSGDGCTYDCRLEYTGPVVKDPDPVVTIEDPVTKYPDTVTEEELDELKDTIITILGPAPRRPRTGVQDGVFPPTPSDLTPSALLSMPRTTLQHILQTLRNAEDLSQALFTIQDPETGALLSLTLPDLLAFLATHGQVTLMDPVGNQLVTLSAAELAQVLSDMVNSMGQLVTLTPQGRIAILPMAAGRGQRTEGRGRRAEGEQNQARDIQEQEALRSTLSAQRSVSGTTGPAALAVMIAGAAGGFAWMRRRKRVSIGE